MMKCRDVVFYYYAVWHKAIRTSASEAKDDQHRKDKYDGHVEEFVLKVPTATLPAARHLEQEQRCGCRCRCHGIRSLKLPELLVT